MWYEHIVMGLAALCAGAAVAGGTFAFLIALGVIPRLIGKSNTAKQIFTYEIAVFLGGVSGNIASVFLDISIPGSRLILAIYGLCAGIFVGCIAVSLAEIINTFPIIFRKFKIQQGLTWIVFSMAMGKLIGAMAHFIKELY